MKFIHSAGIIHNNLNLENLLVNSACDVLLAGFYVSSSVPSTSESCDSHASMFIRNDYNHCAPELLAESSTKERALIAEGYGFPIKLTRLPTIGVVYSPLFGTPTKIAVYGTADKGLEVVVFGTLII